jgi:hypothetical protein
MLLQSKSDEKCDERTHEQMHKGRLDHCDGASWDEDASDGESFFEFVPVWQPHT